MTNRPALLRQIYTEARPYVEQLVELNVAFTGFRKLATDNGLDWGQIKALLRAEIEDGEEGGSEKVDRIIKKAEYAGEYAALLGLGTSNMNEQNSISAPPIDRAERSKRRLSEAMDDSKAMSAELRAAGLISEASHAENIRIADGVAMKLGAGVLNPEPDPDPTPPHDPTTGELIDDVPVTGPAIAPAPGAGSDTITAKGDAGGTTRETTAAHMLAASLTNSAPVAGCASEEGADAIALDVPSSQIKSNAKATEVEPGNAGGTVPARHNNDRAGVASRLAGGRTPAGEGAEPSGNDVPSPLSNPAAGAAEQGLGTAPNSMPGPDLSQSGGALTPDAPVEQSPSRDVAPGAPHSGEMPDLPAIFDRRSKAA